MAKQEPKHRSLSTLIYNAVASADESIVAGLNSEHGPKESGVGDPSPASPASPASPIAPASPLPSREGSGVGLPHRQVNGYVPIDIDMKLSVLSSQYGISKKRMILEALLDYLHKKDLLTEDEVQQWLLLPKDYPLKR